MVTAVDEAMVEIQYEGRAAGHAGAEVETGRAEHADHAAGHVLTAVVADAFNHGVSTRVAHRETLAGHARRKQPAAGGAIQAGVAHDGGFLALEGTAAGWGEDQLAAGHAFADVVVGVALQDHVQPTGIPGAEALADGT